jgi:hypothetical protein
MKSIESKSGLVVALLILAAGIFRADQISTWFEKGDAGQTTTTGQQTTETGPLTEIREAIPNPDGVDLFKIRIFGAFTAITESEFDPMLFLFDYQGNTLLFNDAGPFFNMLSLLSGTFAEGDYWLGISLFPNGFNIDATGNVDSPGFWDLTNNSVGGLPYTIRLTGASYSGPSVPDAGSTAAILGLALFSLAALRRRLGC